MIIVHKDIKTLYLCLLMKKVIVMKIFPTHVIKQLDEYTIRQESITSADLMERAATALTHAITQRWPATKPVTVFSGPGNNGGDALAVARMLSVKGYLVEVYLLNPKGELSPDCQTNKELLQGTGVTFTEITGAFQPPVLTENHLVIDGLFGSGLNKPLRSGYAGIVKYINAHNCTVVAIDMPSGLMGEDNTPNDPDSIIRAHHTFSLQLPKLAFFFADNAPYVGRWHLLDIGLSLDAISDTETPYRLMEEDEIRNSIKQRSRFAHKGHFGHAMLVAGSRGMAGASILSAKACLRSGVGLLTVHAPSMNNSMLQTAVPEAMVDADIHTEHFAESVDSNAYAAIGIGPGLGTSQETKFAVIAQIQSCHKPMVIDADALNILAAHRQVLFNELPRNTILTPHPGEFDRLVGQSDNAYERLMKALELARETKAHIVLKGAYTAIVAPDGSCAFNPTGNPGMATGGSGDVLTGIILALLSQGYAAGEAARIGVYVHGLAADIAAERFTEIAMTAGDIIACLPEAWKRLAK